MTDTTEARTDAAPNPYVGPRAFTRRESRFFFGRDQEVEILTSQVMAYPASLFFAQSGAGKSSLLNAGLIPKLTRMRRVGRGERARLYQEMGVAPVLTVGRAVPTRVERPVANMYVFSALLGLLPDAAPDALADARLADALTDALAKEAERFEASGAAASESGRARPPLVRPDTTLLIFDQFEELFTVHVEHWREREDFFKQVNQALARHSALHVLFSMREDYIAELTPYANLLPDSLRYRFRMERLGRDAALLAVVEPARRVGRDFAEGVAEDLVDNLCRVQVGQRSRRVEQPGTVDSYISPAPRSATGDSNGLNDQVPGAYVEPVHLQIVCYELWNNLRPERTTIEADDVRTFGDVDQALMGFYESALAEVLADARVNVGERALRRWFSEKLITPNRTKGLIYRGEAETEGLPNAAVDSLTDRYIIRAEVRGGDTWYELAHDRLVEPILTANQAWKDKLQNPLTVATEAWLASGKDPQELFRGTQLKEAQAQLEAHPDELSESEKEFIRKGRAVARLEAARRLRVMLLVAAILTVVFAALTVWALRSRLDAQRQREAAFAAQETAEVLRLADAAIDNRDKGDRVLSLLLAIQAVRRTYETGSKRVMIEAEDALRQCLPTTKELDQILVGHEDEIAGLAFSPDGKYLSTVSRDGTAMVWDVSSGEPKYRLTGHYGPVIGVAYSPDGARLATASEDRTAKVWALESSSAGDVVSAQEVLALDGHTDSVLRVSFSPDGIRLVTASADKTVKVWDVASGQELRTLEGHTDAVRDVVFSPDSTYLATASADGTIMVWDVVSGRERYTLTGHTDAVLRVTFSPDGTRLATASSDGTSRIWDVTSGRAVATLAGHTGPVLDVAFSPDGTRLATASEDATARVWDAASGLGLFTLSDHEDSVTHVDFSPDGSQLATASHDSTVKVWSLFTTSRPLTLSGHTDWVSSISFDPDGRHLATAGSDGTARVYTFDIESLLAVACSHADRNLTRDEWETFFRGGVPYQRTCPGLPVHLTVIMEYIRQGQIDRARQEAPDTDLAQAMLDLGKVYASQEGKSREALGALDGAIRLDPTLELEETGSLAGAYNQVCAQGSRGNLTRAVRLACERAAVLAVQTSDAYVNYEVCQAGSVEGLVDIVLPACERAVVLAVKTEDASLNTSVCGQRELIESLAPVVSPACERAEELLATQAPAIASPPPITWVGSPNFNRRESPDDIWAIVVHASGNTSLEGVVQWYNNPQAQVSQHYVIGKDGTVVQAVKDQDRAWHAGKSEWKGVSNVNNFSLGIELVNLNDGIDPYPEEQHRAAVQLVAYLSVKYGIQPDDIVAHYEITVPVGRKTDPRGYDMDRLRREVADAVGAVCTARIGLHGRNDAFFEEADYQLIREARIETLKMMSYTSPEVFERIRDENPGIEFIVRLWDDRMSIGHHPTPEQFADRMVPIMERLRPYVTKFEIHNEPNYMHRYEGWGQEDADARDFTAWFLQVYEILDTECPWAELGFPGLAVTHRDLEWIEIARPAVERADWLGVHAFWETTPDQPNNHLSDFWGLRFKYYHDKFPDKPIEITEFGNINAQSGLPANDEDVAEEYVAYYRELIKYPYVRSASAFIMSSPDATWDSFAWRTVAGEVKPVVQAVRDMSRCQLMQPDPEQVQTPGQAEEIYERVKAIIVEQLGVDGSKVTMDASFREDLEADSLDLVELIMAFEEEFGGEISDQEAQEITTVRQAVDYLKTHMQP